MVKHIVKHKSEFFILLILIAAYFALRLPNLTLQPIFADEAIYIRWAQVMRAEPTLRFLSLSDGKTPLFMWAMIPLLKVFHDPLFAGRLLSVISGLFTLLGVYALAKRAFNAKTAFWSGVLYVITPYTVFFDRMALVDSMLAAFTVWIIYFAIWLVRAIRLDVAMILGYLLGGAVLTKTSGMINLLLLPISLITYNTYKRTKENKYYLLRILFLFLVSIIIALVAYNGLRLGPQFQQLSARNADYLFSPLELIGRPLDPFIPHLRDMADWWPKLFTWPILFCLAVGIFYLIYYLNRVGIVILLWATVPLLLEMAFLKTFTARYLLSSIPPLLIIAGYGIIQILPRFTSLRTISFILMLLVILPLSLYFNYLLLTNPAKAPLPKEEKIGYLEDWTAGYGFAEIADFLIEKSKTNPVAVGTEGFFGTLPDGLQIYLDKEKVKIIPSGATISAEIRQSAQDQLTFFVGNGGRLKGKVSDVILIKEYPKAQPLDGSPHDSIMFYQVLPSK